jgi:hypothetical protein
MITGFYPDSAYIKVNVTHSHQKARGEGQGFLFVRSNYLVLERDVEQWKQQVSIVSKNNSLYQKHLIE